MKQIFLNGMLKAEDPIWLAYVIIYHLNQKVRNFKHL